MMMSRVLSIVLSGLLAACANQQPTMGESEPQASLEAAEQASIETPTTGTAVAQAAPADGQTRRRVRIPPEILQKIGFDLNQFDNEGLLNTSEGKQSIIYEYCIPRAQQAVSMISTIDFTIDVKTDTPGSKVNCGSNEALVTGSSHQDSFKAIIVQIASLPFVKKIEQSRLE